jgi:transcriptional regulator with XRE-family HTH domain
MNMRKRPVWRELLDSLIQVRNERERIAAETGVAPITLTRWASGETSPRLQNLHPLVQAIPDQHRAAFQTSIEEDLPSHSFEPVPDEEKMEIPFQLVSRILATRAAASPHLVSWVIIHQILQHALLQLDPNCLGMKITIVKCMPPRANGAICSLRESIGLGTHPWQEQVEERGLFLGAETFAGHAVTTARSYQVPDMRRDPISIPYSRTEHEISAAACPIMWHGHIAGCLLFSSTQIGAFQAKELNTLLEAYANLVALAFAEKDFYEGSLIRLHVMPEPVVQQQYLVSFRQRVTALMKESVCSEHALTSKQAEEIAWQQIETLLLGHGRHQTLINKLVIEKERS